MYNQTVLSYFKNLKYSGRVRGANAVGKALDKTSGDEVHIFMIIDESGKISQASFKAFGSVLALAASSFACQLLQTKHVKDLAEITPLVFESELGKAPQDKQHVYPLITQCILNAVEYY